MLSNPNLGLDSSIYTDDLTVPDYTALAVLDDVGIPAWNTEFNGASVPIDPGDANADGVVDDKDASILGAHWLQDRATGSTATSTATATSTTPTPPSSPPTGARALAKSRCPSRAALPCWPGSP